MRKAFTVFFMGIGIVIVITFMANNLFRVSTPEKDWGIIEHWVLGRPLIELFFPPWSENYKHWDAASKASSDVADLILEHGIGSLIHDPNLAKERQLAERKSEEALNNATAIPEDYLAQSNPHLPKAYFESFVPAMDSLDRGFGEGDPQMVKQGVSAYNDFLIWMQSHERSDFKPLR